ncbi:hypothetical protein K469DRAFT_782326, partial [Zopfia rhizophila CBS 207.26]
ITFAAATITLGSRLVARRLTKLQLLYDDYLAIIAFICAAVWSDLVLWWLQIGLALHPDQINLSDNYVLKRSHLILWNIELTYVFSLHFSKLAILAFYWRMFKTSNIKDSDQNPNRLYDHMVQHTSTYSMVSKSRRTPSFNKHSWPYSTAFPSKDSGIRRLKRHAGLTT